MPPLICSIYSIIEGMKKITASIITALVFTVSFGQNDLPDVKLKTLTGDEIRFNTLGKNNDTILIVSLWATWCVPCIQELEAISEQYDDRQKETPFKTTHI